MVLDRGRDTCIFIGVFVLVGNLAFNWFDLKIPEKYRADTGEIPVSLVRRSLKFSFGFLGF